LKGYLLDTSVALVAIHQSVRLSSAVRAALERGPSFLSVISYWEVMIKSMKGALDVGDPRQWWTETLDALALFPLLYQPEHIAAIYHLPPIHRDPFDRALIAQATVEDLTLLTTDVVIPRYASQRFRVIQ
jgi:PIN domain nuclease of toxin-antitoxin system